MRSERGQTAAEYLGMLLVVSIVIAAVGTTDAGATIAGESRRLVCEIGGGSDCGSPPAPQPAPTPVPTPGPAPTPSPEVEGPPLTGGPVPVLPFPGSVTVKCTFDARQPQTCMPDDKPGVTVKATGELTVERSETALDETGCPSQTLSIATSLELGPNAQAGNTTASGWLAGYLGQAVNYELTVSPEAANPGSGAGHGDGRVP